MIDTIVLQSANAPITKSLRRGSLFAKRVRLLEDLRAGNRILLYSRILVHEYETKVRQPRNDFVKAFFEILNDPRRSIANWAKWTGSRRQRARKCRYPEHDDHLLRTAVRPNPTTIVTEERGLLQTGACIYRQFRIRIKHVADL